MDSAIRDLAQANQSTMLRALAATSQVRVAEMTGLSETTISRQKESGGSLEKLCELAAACGVRFVRADSKQVDSEHLRALTVLAARSIKLEAQTSGWGDLL